MVAGRFDGEAVLGASVGQLAAYDVNDAVLADPMIKADGALGLEREAVGEASRTFSGITTDTTFDRDVTAGSVDDELAAGRQLHISVGETDVLGGRQGPM